MTRPPTHPSSFAGRRAPLRCAGFTLVEMTIAASLMAIVLMAAYACLQAGLNTQRLLEPRLEAVQAARVALGLLTADLRCACPLSRDVEFVGMNRKISGAEAGNLDFGTLNHTPSKPGEGDFCQTSYFVEPDPATGARVLWRRRNPRIAPDPFAGGSREEIAWGVEQLKFEFYDGYEWYDSWGDPQGNRKEGGADKVPGSASTAWNLSGMPEAVRITLAVQVGQPVRKPTEPGIGESAGNPEAPMVFQTVVRINVPKSSTTTDSGDGGGGGGSSPGSQGAGGGSPGVPAFGPGGG
jgi:prepilin-type N-terminal cleavage/methylation domain-containing protein